LKFPFDWVPNCSDWKELFLTERISIGSPQLCHLRTETGQVYERLCSFVNTRRWK